MSCYKTERDEAINKNTTSKYMAVFTTLDELMK